LLALAGEVPALLVRAGKELQQQPNPAGM